MIPREKQRGRAWIYMILALLLASATALAGTTGNLTGFVTGQNNAPIAGVKVLVKSPVMQGAKTTITDSQGFYRLTQLPPGDGYRALFEKAGFQTTERTGIVINIDATIKLPTVRMKEVQKVETIEVVDTAPVVDVGSTTVGRTISSEFLASVPTGRTTTSVMALAPGASSDGLGVTFRGASSPENRYVIDGLNVTDAMTGLSGSSLPPEFIQEIQVKTGGYEAEFGRATGGQALIITKSGGNEFHGNVFAYVTPLEGKRNAVVVGQDDPATAVEEASLVLKSKLLVSAQPGFDIGGYIIKDRLWFFVGYAPTIGASKLGRDFIQLSTLPEEEREDPAMSENADWQTPWSVSNFYIANVTLNLNQDHSLRFSVNGQPGVAHNVSSLRTGEQRYSTTKGGTQDYLLKYAGRFAGGLANLDVIMGLHQQWGRNIPNGDVGQAPSVSYTVAKQIDEANWCKDPEGNTVPCTVQAGVWADGGLGYVQDQRQNRFVFNPVLSIFLNNVVGSHVIKVGGDVEFNSVANKRRYTGGMLVEERATAWRERYFTFNGEPLLEKDENGEYAFLGAETRTLNTSAFIQDSWSILSNLSINLGVRWERQQLKDPQGVTRIDIKDMIAPRFGFIFDFTKQGKSKVFANAGRYYESIPQDLNDRALAAEGFNYYQFRKAIYPEYTPGAQPLDENTLVSSLGGEQSPVQKDLKGQYKDEYLLGVEYELAKNLKVGVTGIYNTLGSIIEDISPDDAATYIIANPGIEEFEVLVVTDPTQPSEVATYEDGTPVKYTRCFSSVDALTGAPVTYCFPKATRAYQGLELTVERRLTDNLQVQAAYTLSRTYGNYPGLFTPENGQLDPNITSQFDLPGLLGNRQGYLSNDRRHIIKLSGSYSFPFGLQAGLVAGLQSGTPVQYLGAHAAYGTSEAFILPRGVKPEDSDAVARTSWLPSVDASVGYGLAMGADKKKTLMLGVQAFNLFNFQQAISVDQDYTYETVSIAYGGTRLDQVQCWDDYGTAKLTCTPNPNFGEKASYQAPFSVRFNAKFSF